MNLVYNISKENETDRRLETVYDLSYRLSYYDSDTELYITFDNGKTSYPFGEFLGLYDAKRISLVYCAYEEIHSQDDEVMTVGKLTEKLSYYNPDTLLYISTDYEKGVKPFNTSNFFK